MQRGLMEDLGLAEIAREGDVLLVGDLLVGEDHDQMLHPRVVDLLDGFSIDRLGHVDAMDLGAERGMPWLDCDRHRFLLNCSLFRSAARAHPPPASRSSSMSWR